MSRTKATGRFETRLPQSFGCLPGHKADVLTGIDKVFYQNVCPVTADGLYPPRNPDSVIFVSISVAKLEKIRKRALILRDIDDKNSYNSHLFATSLLWI